MSRACLVLTLLTIVLAACAENPHPGATLTDCIPKPTLKDVFTCAQKGDAPAPDAKPAGEKAQ